MVYFVSSYWQLSKLDTITILSFTDGEPKWTGLE